MSDSKKVKNIKNLRPIRNELFLFSFGPILLVFAVSFILIYFSSRDSAIKNLKKNLTFIANQKETEFNACFSSVERSVESISRYILETLDEERTLTDKKYEKEYFTELEDRLSRMASIAKDSVAVYFRLEQEKYGGKSGVFMSGSRKTGFISVSPTDLTQYAPTDTEHVCWYYAPLWKGSAVWVEPYINKNVNKYLLSYSMPLYRNKKFFGVTGIDINLATIKNISDSLPLEECSAILLTSDKTLIYDTTAKNSSNAREIDNTIRSLKVFYDKGTRGEIQEFVSNETTRYGIRRDLQNGMTLIISLPVSALSENKNFLNVKLLLLLIVSLAVETFLVWLCDKQVLEPVSDLTKASYRLSRGELGIPILYRSNNEIGFLADSIRKMAVQIREYIEFIREQTKSEREAKESAISASKAKGEFLANMSHEIRTPINAVLGMDEMILRESDDKEILEYAVNIKKAGNSLLSIVNDVLDFSKIESGKMELIPETYDFSSILVDIISMISERAAKKNLDFIININPNIPKLLIGDSFRIKQCITNLLTNAIKYTDDGHILFEIEFDEKNSEENKIQLSVSIEDTGIGIKEKDIEKLFSPFERIEEERNRTIEGTGLGISLVQNILKLMNSTLQVHSVYTEGSRFSFTIEQEKAGEDKIGDIMESYHKALEFTEKYRETLIAPKARLLFADDTKMNLEVVKGLLKKTKIQLDLVMSGKEAIQKACENEYDIIFIDHRMPVMDGIETLEEMKASVDNKNPEKPYIALTANAISGAREMYLDAGFTDYLSKPINPKSLSDIIRKYLPPQLIQEEAEANQTDGNEKTEQEEENPPEFPKISGVDFNVAMENCGNASLVRDMVRMFYNSIEKESEDLENFVKEKDLENFRIKVHALKSSARIIGAKKLSSMAERLEKNAGDKDIDTIQKKLPELLKFYRGYLAKFSKFINNEVSEFSENIKLSSEAFRNRMENLSSAVEDFNSNECDKWLKEMSSFSVPEEFSEFFSQIKNGIECIDFAQLKKLTDDFKNRYGG
ncbi:MAG: response regulator [Treponema sp.]|nr:response regulator [Treponema sp.]